MESSPISIRVMRKEDRSALVEIDAITGGWPRPDYIQSKVDQALDTKYSMLLALVAEIDGKVVGFIMGEVFRGEFGIPEDAATVDTVGIHPDYQRRGVGRLLMEAFVSHARNAGVEWLRTMVDWKKRDLLNFFATSGFAPGTALVLERRL